MQMDDRIMNKNIPLSFHVTLPPHDL